MSSLREKIPAALLRGLITWLLALGLGMPLLCGAGLSFLLPRYILLCAAVSAVCALLNLKKRILPLTLAALFVLEGVLLAQGRGFFRETAQLGQALYLLLRNLPLALSLQGSALCLQLAVLLTLLCYALSSPELDVALPLTLTAGFLGAEWMLGLRAEWLYMLPALPALLLIYAFTHSYADADAARPDRPSFLLLPVAAVLLALAYLLAPPDGTKAPALASAADQLREMINDRFFFQQERARYTLEADGWMPQGEKRLGGRPDPDDRLVMEVETDETVYLRGAILDTYTGAAWYDSVSARRYYWDSPLQRALRDSLIQAEYPLDASLPEKEVTVRFESAGASTLFVPQRMRSLTVGPHMTPYFNLSSEVFITRNLQAGDTYTLRYLPMKATDSGMAALAAQCAGLEDPSFAEAAATYTALPSHIQKEIYDIAAAVTANCATPWEKAVALREYLRTSFGYTLDVSDPPADVDFVAWFLLAEKKGYCTYFASAMTVLCRMAGLPARYVEGYVASPDVSSVAVVRGIHAHAWTEVYLSGLGWVTFDATPGRGDRDSSGSAPLPAMGKTPTPPPPQDSPSPVPTEVPTPTPPPEADPPAGEETPTPTPAPEAPENTPEPPEPPEPDASPRLPWLWLLLVLALILLLALRIRVTEPQYRAAHAADEGAALLILWRAILACAGKLKTPQQPGETVLAYAVRAGNALGTSLLGTARTVSALRYGRHRPRRSDVRTAREIYASLRERLPMRHKLILALKRAFLCKNA